MIETIMVDHPNRVQVVEVDDDETDTMSDESSSTRNNSNSKRVQFATASIYVFPITLGDNPSVVKGPPLQMERFHTNVFHNVPLEETAALRRRSSRVRPLERTRRIHILKDYGFTMPEIQQAEKEAMVVRNHRLETRTQSMKRERQWERHETLKSLFRWNSAQDRKLLKVCRQLAADTPSSPTSSEDFFASLVVEEEDDDDSSYLEKQ